MSDIKELFNKTGDQLNGQLKEFYSGIECPTCDFEDLTVPFEELPNWVNKKCPKCGTIIITEQAMQRALMHFDLVGSIFRIAKSMDDNPEMWEDEETEEEALTNLAIEYADDPWYSIDLAALKNFEN